MSILMTLRIALKALNRNKMRTVLTMLGMIIGVGAVITMVALGTRRAATIEEQVKSAGTNMIIVNAGNFSTGGVRRARAMSTTLMPDDAEALRAAARRAVRRCGRQLARAGHRRQPELVDADPGHGRRPAAHPQLADQIRQFLHAAGRQQRRKGRRARHGRVRHAVRAGRRSDRADHPRHEPAVQGDRRDDQQGAVDRSGRTRTTRSSRPTRPCRRSCRGSSTSTTSRSRRSAPTRHPGHRREIREALRTPPQDRRPATRTISWCARWRKWRASGPRPPRR